VVIVSGERRDSLRWSYQVVNPIPRTIQDSARACRPGLTNPEVAGRLYVSRKAVEHHLGNIYGKLGITGRRELRDLELPASPVQPDLSSLTCPA